MTYWMVTDGGSIWNLGPHQIGQCYSSFEEARNAALSIIMTERRRLADLLIETILMREEDCE